MIQTLVEKLYVDDNENNLFSLSIKEILMPTFNKSIFSIVSDVLPHLMIKQYNALISPKFIYKIEDGIREIDNEYLSEVLDFIGSEIKLDIDFKAFFYNSLFLDLEKNVRTEITSKYYEAQKQINNGDFELINNKNKLHLFHFQQLMFIPKKYIKKELFFHKISRKEFEINLSTFYLQTQYVDSYFNANEFLLILNSENNPLYYLALNEKREPILVLKSSFLD